MKYLSLFIQNNNTKVVSGFQWKHWIYDYLIELNVSETLAVYLNITVLIGALLLIIFITDYIIRKILIVAFSRFAERSKTNFDDLLVKNKAPRNLAHIIPLLIAIAFVPGVFSDFPYTEMILERALKVFAILLTLWIIRSILNTLKDYLKTLENHALPRHRRGAAQTGCRRWCRRWLLTRQMRAVQMPASGRCHRAVFRFRLRACRRVQ